MIQLCVKKNKVGRSTYLIPYKEYFVVASSDIEGDHGFTIETPLMASELNIAVA